MAGVPLVTEAAFRWGWPAAGIPAATALGVAITRTLAGKPPRLSGFAHQLTAFVSGLGLRSLESRRVAVLRGRLSDERDGAPRLGARLEGRSRAFSRKISVMGDDAPMPIRDVFTNSASWLDKEKVERVAPELAALCTPETLDQPEFAYLDMVLKAWRREYNREHAALSEQVNMFVVEPAEAGMTVLDKAQIAELRIALATLRARGHVVVRVSEWSLTRRLLVLDVGGQVVRLGRRGIQAFETADPTPAGALFGMLFAAAQATSASDWYRQPPVVPGVVAFGALAPVSSELVQFRGSEAHESILGLRSPPLWRKSLVWSDCRAVNGGALTVGRARRLKTRSCRSR